MKRAFTLVELLVAIAIIAILAALLFPGINAPKGNARRAICMSNLRQISVGIRLYLDDQSNAPLGNTNATHTPFLSWTDYRPLINNYVGVKTASSPEDKVFACPADTFFYDLSQGGRGYVSQPLHEQADHAFTSYGLNAGQFTTPVKTKPPMPATTNFYGVAGRRLEAVPHQSTTVLLAEVPAYNPYSWHQPKRPFSKDNALFADARDVICFVDGHVGYLKIYYDGKKIAWAYNPPAGYDYQWSGD